MNIKEAITKYQKELERVQGILDKLEKVQHLAAVEVTPETSLEELICKRYLQVGKVEDVLKEVKSVGMKQYKSTDISDVIKARKVVARLKATPLAKGVSPLTIQTQFNDSLYR